MQVFWSYRTGAAALNNFTLARGEGAPNRSWPGGPFHTSYALRYTYTASSARGKDLSSTNSKIGKSAMIVLGVMAVLGSVAILDTMRHKSIESGDFDVADYVNPQSLARLVEKSSAVVVAHYVQLSDLGTATLATTPPNVSGPPSLEMSVVGTQLMVDDVLKSDSAVTVTTAITYGMAGDLPTNSMMLELDANSHFPHAWSTDTEFIVFLNKEDGMQTYYINGWRIPNVETCDGYRRTCRQRLGVSGLQRRE